MFVDRRSALGCLRRGRLVALDLAALAEAVIDRVPLELHATHFIWVPSEFNPANVPSRGDQLGWGARVPLRIRWEPLRARLERLRG